MSNLECKYSYQDRTQYWFLHLNNMELATFGNFHLFDNYIRKQFSYDVTEHDCGTSIKYKFQNRRDALRAQKIFYSFYENKKLHTATTQPLTDSELIECMEWCYLNLNDRLADWKY